MVDNICMFLWNRYTQTYTKKGVDAADTYLLNFQQSFVVRNLQLDIFCIYSYLWLLDVFTLLAPK